ncbi:MAG TPA: glycosyltransferase [Burkholderiales bacterium]|nr:glycosyltransferase [Burkholderiales bacterium]
MAAALQGMVVPGTRETSVTVCIASIGRTSLLATLRSISDGNRPSYLRIDVVIADDSRTGAAAFLLEGESAWPFPVVVIPTAACNVAIARNACLDAARGDYLAFVDDDEWVESTWLVNLIEQAEATGADAVFGPVVAIFPPATPDWIRKAGPFVKHVGVHGSRVLTGSTCNALVRRASIERLGLRFLEKFGVSGGEDTDFFARLGAAGAILVASERAVLYEVVPTERLQLAHLRRRYVRGGQSYAQAVMADVPPLRQVIFYAMAFFKLVIAVGVVAIAIPFRREIAMKYAFKAWLNAGKLRHAAGYPLSRLYDAPP